MWCIEDFGEDDYLFAQFYMPAMEDDILRSLIRVRNTDDWIRGVGHPIETGELSRFNDYLTEPIVPNDNHVYFVACYQR